MEISVSKSKFLFQTRFFVSKRFLGIKSAKITVFVAPRGVMINAAYIENGVGGISVFVSCDNRRRGCPLKWFLLGLRHVNNGVWNV